MAGGKARWVSTRRRKRHTPEQVVPKLQEADRLLADGADGPEVSKVWDFATERGRHAAIVIRPTFCHA